MDSGFYPAPDALPLLLQHAAWVVLSPVAWFLVAALSRARLLAIAALDQPRVRGRRGRKERRERIRRGLPVPEHPGLQKRALGPVKCDGIEDDAAPLTNARQGAVVTWDVRLVLGVILCIFLLFLDMCLVWSVSDDGVDAAICVFFGGGFLVRFELSNIRSRTKKSPI